MKRPRLKRIVKAAKMSMIQEYEMFAAKSMFFLKKFNYHNIVYCTHTYYILFIYILFILI